MKFKIRVFSDIHNEIRRYYIKSKCYKPWVPDVLPDDKDTVLILAGDIDHVKQLPDYLNLVAPRFKAVIHVNGNHEFYGSDLANCKRRMQEADLAANVYHLDNDTVTIDGQHFIGGTMWTDLTGREYPVEQVMNDYRQIRLGGNAGYRKLRATDTTYLHREFMYFLANSITKDSIIVTHHSPLSPGNSSLGGFNPYGKQPSSTDYAYHACLEDFMIEHRPKAWISGHTHECYHHEDYFGIQLINNGVGYYREEGDFQQEPFDV